jgi:hypothetical protein
MSKLIKTNNKFTVSNDVDVDTKVPEQKQIFKQLTKPQPKSMAGIVVQDDYDMQLGIKKIDDIDDTSVNEDDDDDESDDDEPNVRIWKSQDKLSNAAIKDLNKRSTSKIHNKKQTDIDRSKQRSGKHNF